MVEDQNSLTCVPPEKVARDYGVSLEALKSITRRYPMRISSHYYGLIEDVDDPIWRQCIPDPKELCDPYGKEDPLNEERDSPVPWLTHRYPDRVLMCVSNQCATYCRFCTRKRMVGDPKLHISDQELMHQIAYVKEHEEVRDVLVSGGDPFMLSDERLEFILSQLREIRHVEIIRIGTRVPCTFPQRVTEKLANILRRYHPLYVNIHFNHPREVNDESARACGLLSDAGIPLGSQTVLLKSVNDDPKTMKSLMQKLLTVRVRPYYLFQADPVLGTYHFKTSVERGLEIIQELIGYTSGLAVPHYVIDAPGGGGKVPLLPDYLESINDKRVIIRNYRGRRFEYTQRQASSMLDTEEVLEGERVVAEYRANVQS